MSEPKRWVEDGAPPDVEQLFRAARAERPDEASLGRTLAALGSALSAVSLATGAGAAGTAAGAAKLSAPITLGSLAQWTAVGAALGTLTVGAVAVVRELPRREQVPAPAARPSSPPSPVSRPASVPEQPASAEPSPSASSAEQRVASPASRAATALPSSAPLDATPAEAAGAPLDVETLTEEVRNVDRARAALAAGRPAQTLALLDEYERHFPQRRFAPEALFLRMEALLSLGRTAEARLAAQRLLASYPGTPNGARARAVLTKSP